MKTLKIYLDTSVISHLQHNDAPDKMADTLKLWEEIKAGKYNTFISNITLDEIEKCFEPKRTLLFSSLNEIEYNLIKADIEVHSIAQKFIDNNILTSKSFDDCRHIACAIMSECDIIVSWNFKHIVNHKTIRGVKLVSAITGYDEVAIYTPTILIEGGNDE